MKDDAKMKSVPKSATYPSHPEMTRGVGEPTTPLIGALEALASSIITAHGAINTLQDTLEPFLPRRIFDLEEAKQDGDEKEDAGYSEHNDDLSATVLNIHRGINELNRLITRINWVNSQVVR